MAKNLMRGGLDRVRVRLVVRTSIINQCSQILTSYNLNQVCSKQSTLQLNKYLNTIKFLVASASLKQGPKATKT